MTCGRCSIRLEFGEGSSARWIASAEASSTSKDSSVKTLRTKNDRIRRLTTMKINTPRRILRVWQVQSLMRVIDVGCQHQLVQLSSLGSRKEVRRNRCGGTANSAREQHAEKEAYSRQRGPPMMHVCLRARGWNWRDHERRSKATRLISRELSLVSRAVRFE